MATDKYKILFKYHSRNNPTKFLSVINNIINNISDKDNFKILVSADKDDASMYNKQILNSIKKYIDSGKLIICYDTFTSQDDAINRDIELVSDYDILIYISDDTEFTFYGFDEAIRNHFKDNEIYDNISKDFRKLNLNGRVTKDNIYDNKGNNIDTTHKQKVIYITGWYDEKNEERKVELETCINKTIESEEFDEVILLCENCNPIGKVSHANINRRPTYEDFFVLANKSGSEGDIVVISNTDIYPEKGTKELLKNIKQDECYALSRWDVDSNGNSEHFCRRDSQDMWVFKLPIVNIKADFYMGNAGCDNAICDRIKKAGYKISNPSKTIKFNHLHLVNVRNYNEALKVDKPYLLITPTELEDSNVVLDVII
jgi:hypothetical protein